MARILIVDDAPFMRNMIKTILLQNDHTVAGEASNGAEAVDLYQELMPDLVTMDITMPVLDGIEAIERIIAGHPAAKIIVCSTVGQQVLVRRAMEAGARDFIVKPFDELSVINAIRKNV
ncbi:MAG: cheY [Bacilli bacterium]|nr:cheY [Bacilli bacterium]